MKATIAICLFALILTGCSGGAPQASAPTIPSIVPQAQAQEITPPMVLIADKLCTSTSGGCIEFEDPGYFLQLRLGPIGATKPTIITYRLPYDFKLKRLDSWVGTGFDSRLEGGGWFQYKKPDGHTAQFLLEIDKHVDNNGEKQRHWDFPTPILLPAGTLITVYSGGAYAPLDKTPANCDWPAPGCGGGYDVRFFMYSE